MTKEYFTNKQLDNMYDRTKKLLNGENKNTYGFAPAEIQILIKEIERLNNIIKEAKEYIDNDFNRFNCFGSMAVSMEMNYKREELLEILDKGV